MDKKNLASSLKKGELTLAPSRSLRYVIGRTDRKNTEKLESLGVINVGVSYFGPEGRKYEEVTPISHIATAQSLLSDNSLYMISYELKKIRRNQLPMLIKEIKELKERD